MSSVHRLIQQLSASEYFLRRQIMNSSWLSVTQPHLAQPHHPTWADSTARSGDLGVVKSPKLNASPYSPQNERAWMSPTSPPPKRSREVTQRPRFYKLAKYTAGGGVSERKSSCGEAVQSVAPDALSVRSTRPSGFDSRSGLGNPHRLRTT